MPDTSHLTPANDNPWYILMTLYGEQTKGRFNYEQLKQNIAAWNSWSTRNFTDEELSLLRRLQGDKSNDIVSWEIAAKRIEKDFVKAWSVRRPSFIGPPPSLKNLGPPVLSNLELNTEFWMSGMVFGDGLRITGCRMTQDFLADHCILWGTVVISETRFAGQAYFANINFRDSAHLSYNEFYGQANFFNANFRSSVFMSSNIYKDDSSFSHAVFRQGVDHSKSEFHGFVDFGSCRFASSSIKKMASAGFQNVRFTAPTSFQNAVFPASYPDLAGAILHESTSFTIDNQKWPEKDWKMSHLAQRNCSILRHVMAKQALPEEEHFFFRREMHHAARSEPFWKTGHIYLFEAVSDFGYSIARPANLLLALWLLGAMIFYEATQFGFFKSLSYSFANMFKFFGLHRTYFDFEVIRLWPGWLQWVSGAQTVLAFILLFFLGLGLRTRFRLR